MLLGFFLRLNRSIDGAIKLNCDLNPTQDPQPLSAASRLEKSVAAIESHCPRPNRGRQSCLLTFVALNHKKAGWEFSSAMVRYQARSCPKCHYYLGYAIESSPIQSEAVLTSFCLNCTYQLPVRAVVRCIKTTTACTPASKPEVLLLQDAEAPSRDARSPVMSSAAVQAPEPAVARATYARDLRAIGQSLEKLEFTTFNLKRSGRSYFVWSTEPASPAQESHHPGSRSELNVRGSATVGSAVPTWLDRFAGSRYNPCDIARLENEGRQNRRRGFTHDHRLSRLLRTIGEHLARRNEQMLAIAWQKQQIGVVTRNLKGRLEMNLFRPEALYDLAAQMHLQRF